MRRWCSGCSWQAHNGNGVRLRWKVGIAMLLKMGIVEYEIEWTDEIEWSEADHCWRSWPNNLIKSGPLMVQLQRNVDLNCERREVLLNNNEQQRASQKNDFKKRMNGSADMSNRSAADFSGSSFMQCSRPPPWCNNRETRARQASRQRFSRTRNLTNTNGESHTVQQIIMTNAITRVRRNHDARKIQEPKASEDGTLCFFHCCCYNHRISWNLPCGFRHLVGKASKHASETWSIKRQRKYDGEASELCCETTKTALGKKRIHLLFDDDRAAFVIQL